MVQFMYSHIHYTSVQIIQLLKEQLPLILYSTLLANIRLTVALPLDNELFSLAEVENNFIASATPETTNLHKQA